jgi:hypothetical protein
MSDFLNIMTHFPKSKLRWKKRFLPQKHPKFSHSIFIHAAPRHIRSQSTDTFVHSLRAQPSHCSSSTAHNVDNMTTVNGKYQQVPPKYLTTMFSTQSFIKKMCAYEIIIGVCMHIPAGVSPPSTVESPSRAS